MLKVNSIETSVCLMQILYQSMCMTKTITSLLLLRLNCRNTRTSSPGPSRPGQVSPRRGSCCCSCCLWGRYISYSCKCHDAGLLYGRVAQWIIQRISWRVLAHVPALRKFTGQDPPKSAPEVTWQWILPEYFPSRQLEVVNSLPCHRKFPIWL